VLLVGASSIRSDCIWYDSCGCNPDLNGNGNPDTCKALNCKYDGPPKEASEEHKNLIKEVCPHMLEEVDNDGICCSTGQLELIKENFAMPASIFKEQCPTCYYNFVKKLL